jgi:ribonuclease E
MRLRDLGGLIVVDFIDMEESKNRREVEQRLRDALRNDRARVQFSSISKFGLLELSRQRLRPALSEGNHITCPRCNGTGHIRDTESSALQILRMVQEESMKDNTAAVHVQVPVEVTSFLLNEKRTEITKIELKQRVTVLLVPNKHLETPNYKLERLRHDDPRLENLQASYTMIEEPDEEVGITRREKNAKPRQEPIIKGVLPDQPAPPRAPAPPPAPVPAPVAAAPVAAPAALAPAPMPPGGGFFGWVKRMFSSPAPTPAAAPAPTAAPAPVLAPAAAGADDKREGRDGRRGGRGERGERSERGGDRDRGGRGSREGRGSRDGADTRPPREAGEARDGRGNRDGRRAEGAAPTDRPAEDRAPRADRSDRGDRGERGEGRRGPRADRPAAPRSEEVRETSDATAVQAFVDTAPAAADGTVAADGERDGRRRRRRGGRGRGEGRAEEGVNGELSLEAGNATAEVDGGTNTVAANPEAGAEVASAGEGAADGARDGSRRRGRGRDRFRREPREDGVDAAAPAEGEVLPEAVPGELTPASHEAAPTAAAAVAPVAVATFAEPAPAAEAAPATEPAVPAPVAATTVTPAVYVAPARYELPSAELQALAEGAGLQWVGSDADKVRAVQAAMAAEPRPIHVPREPKPVTVIDEGPLVLVETRKDLSQLKLPFDSQPGA